MTDALAPVRADGEPEPDWSWLPEDTPPPTPAALTDARQQTAALLTDRGVTYGTLDGGPWRLDPVPTVLDEATWSSLERAVAQRSAVLDAVLADLYGPRTLLGDRLIPPELVLADPEFLRAVDGVVGPGPRRLVLHAVDLARHPSGAWLALADRAQAPSGAAYAMVDRRVVAQSMARVYRRTPIRRLGPFFHALRRALDAAAPMAPGSSETPQTVLLTPGPHSETAFDQAYLATMLGVPLVEGSDLAVRDGRVWLEGMAGPEPVDVILRRVDAQWCDPLDLRADSRLGVPGLVRALRAGTVAVVNPLGSGVLEHPGLAAYLPRVARAVLGEDLTLASPATWWCGEPASRAHALAHLDSLVLMSSDRVHPVLGWTLDAAARDDLAVRIAAEPLRWTAQEPVPGATGAPAHATGATTAHDATGAPAHGTAAPSHGTAAPSHGTGAPSDGTAAPSHGTGTPSHGTAAPAGATGVLRTFAVADDGDYRVLAGGLALVAPAGVDVVSSSLGAVARDVWVIAADAETAPDPWATSADELLPRRTVSLPPRTAENLFWLTRYAERAGDTVRLLRAVVDRWYDDARRPETPGGRALAVLLDAIGAHHPAGWPYASHGGSPLTGDRERRRLRALLLDRDEPGTVAWSVRHLADAAAAVRDQMSNDFWLPLASMERALEVEAAAERAPGSTTGLLPVLDRLLEALLALAGVAGEGMLRDPGWYLMDAGRRLERSMYLVESLDATVTTVRPDDVESHVLESLLIAHESSITYRRRHSGRPDLPGVLDLLLGDARNPRSLVFQLDRLRDDLAHVPAASTDARDRLVQDLLDLAGELDPRPASAAVGDRREHLAEVLESLRWRLAGLADEVAAAHFAHRPAGRALGEQWGPR